jgi:hypothetical protein
VCGMACKWNSTTMMFLVTCLCSQPTFDKMRSMALVFEDVLRYTSQVLRYTSQVLRYTSQVLRYTSQRQLKSAPAWSIVVESIGRTTQQDW